MKATAYVFVLLSRDNKQRNFKLPSQGRSVYPPKTHGPFLMIVTVSLFPSHLL